MMGDQDKRKTRQNSSIMKALEASGLSPTKLSAESNNLSEDISDLRSLMLEIKQSLHGQESKLNDKMDQISDKMEASIKTLGDQLKASFKEQMDDLQKYVDQEIGVITTRIEDVETRLDSIESKVDPGDFDPEVTVVARGLSYETTENIQEKTTDLVRRGLSLQNVPVVKALRLPARGRRPGIVKIQCRNLDEKKAVLKRKFDLQNEGNPYKGVHLRTAFSHVERVHQDNIRQVLKLVEGGDQFYFTGSGKLEKKPSGREGRNGRNSVGGAEGGEHVGH